MLNAKRMFMRIEEEGIRQPFEGLQTSDGIQAGLFPVRSTGVSTEPVRLAAEEFLGNLKPYQLMRTQFGYDDVEWRRWFNVDNGIYSRRGTPLVEMTPEQKESAMALLRVSLSAKGLAQSKAIMLTDQALRELNGDNRDPHAKIKMDEVLAHMSETWFAWIGPTDDAAVFYYRIHSPVILIEFDHQTPVGTPMLQPQRVPIRDHIHTIVRTPNGNDYGKDLLAQHIAQSHSGQ
jgi:hypothetical protein